MCLVDDSDGRCTVLHSRQQRARLRHRCTECGRDVQAGEIYLAERTVFDGAAMSHKICAHCQRVRAYLMDHCSGWMYQGLGDDISGHYYSTLSNDADDRESRLLNLGMTARWRRADGALWPVPRGETPNVAVERAAEGRPLEPLVPPHREEQE